MTAQVANSLWRRLTRFTLRSLLVAMVVASFGLAWYSHHYRNYQTELRFINDLSKIQDDKPVDFGTNTNNPGFLITSNTVKFRASWLSLNEKLARVSVRWHGPEFLAPSQKKQEHSVFSRVDALSLREYPLPKTTSTLPALRQLEITSNLRQLSDEDLEQLAQLDNLEELILLGFNKTAPPLKHLPAKLQKLTLGNAISIFANSGIRELQKSRPELEIYTIVAGKKERLEFK